MAIFMAAGCFACFASRRSWRDFDVHLVVSPLCSTVKTGMNMGSLHVARRVLLQALQLRKTAATHAGFLTRPSAANLQLLTACRAPMQAALQTVSNPRLKDLDDLPNRAIRTA